MSYNYDVLKERNKREKFALDLCDMLINKYFDKTDAPIVSIEDGQLYEFRLRTAQCSLFDYDKVKVYLPSYMFEFKVITSNLRDKVDEELSSIKYKFISESNFAEWRDKYNFNLENLSYSTGEIQYRGSDCTPEQLLKAFTFLSMHFDQMHNLIDTAVKAFKKYYKDIKIKTISFEETFKETKNDG